ncbi:MBL fold metallo-hydrolase [candidate division WOR-3 bacterium]|nr:MBL fold metallo-hydrolase [candidate division WOR-3 bacterium]
MKRNKFKITVLMDDQPGYGLKNEHGFSALIENRDDSILFDTGQSGAFIDNALKLGKNLQKVSKVVISHGHYDHIGGLRDFLEINRKAKVYIKKEAFYKKLKIEDGKYQSIGLSDDLSVYTSRFVFSEEVSEISKGIYISANIQNHGYRIHNKNMFTEVDGIIEEDRFDDEQFLFIKFEDQAFIISGCSHRGIVNIVKSAISQSNCSGVKGILGGFHMLNENEEDVNREMSALKKINPKIIAPCHCTGEIAIHKFKKMFSQNYFHIKTGINLEV